ncbi:MAG TPA: dihydroorotate dehydrogenase electron transfer subunit [Anaerovoracaceae bacterium]|nr:dihydroorotate dehydrogenase electron transfer subunit [Anaerovoracaceae bacterium]
MQKVTGSGINKAGIIEAEIISNTEIARDVYQLVLQCGEGADGMHAAFAEANPGQFINVYLRDKSMLLPRPISICFAEGDRITLVYRVVGKGTKALSGYRGGEIFTVSTPLGKGYDIGAVIRVLGAADKTVVALVAGGLGVPPMLELAKAVRAQLGKARLIAALGFQDELFLTEELKSFCDEVHIATDSGAAGFRGNVLEMMEVKGIKADYYLSCGPRPMLKALAEHCGRANKPLQVSLEERMGCGYGACVGCTCRIRETAGGENAAETDVIIKRKKVCADGPVFFGEEVVWDD